MVSRSGSRSGNWTDVDAVGEGSEFEYSRACCVIARLVSGSGSPTTTASPLTKTSIDLNEKHEGDGGGGQGVLVYRGRRGI